MLTGVVALVTLIVHASLYLAIKADGEINVRSRCVASVLWPVQVLLTIPSLVATLYIRPGVLATFNKWPVGYLIPIVVAGSLIYLFVALRSKTDKGAFLAPCGYIVGMLVGAAFALYSNVLPASTDLNLI